MMRVLLILSLGMTLNVGEAQPFGWRRTSASPPKFHTLKFWLRSSRPELLDRELSAVSSPSSTRFRQYLTDDQISQIVAPDPDVKSALEQWLVEQLSSGFSLQWSKHGEFGIVRAQTEDWNRVFSDELVSYEHESGEVEPVTRLASLNASTVASLEHVRAVFGLLDFYPVTNRSTSPASDCHQFKGDQIDPNVIAAQYKSPPPTDQRPGFGKHSQAVAAFEDAEFKPSDVAQFQADYNLTAIKVQVIGPNNGGYYGEASLDTQYIFSTGSGIDTYFLSQKQFDLLEWSWLVMNMSHPPAVLSISWGNGESGFDVQHQHAASAEFAKMGLKGISILAASGDEGTGGHGGILGCKQFDPTWPASSPYVTAVGGSYLASGSELGWSSSGGGFSSVFGRPSYQDEKIESYLKTTKLPSSSLFNASGRATPDVAALSTNFRTLSLGAYGCISGTSAATPVFAGLVSSINDQLVSQGKPTVGFLNPTLYQAANGVGFDVTEGNNRKPGCPSGFEAQTGYDCVTGLGTPLMDVLSKALIPS